MNREIKFRAWDKINKKMVYNVGIGPDGKLSPNAEIYASSWKVNQNALDFFQGLHQLFEFPQQFTDLYDKNGKEVYEGDILKSDTSYPLEVFWMGIAWGVRWNDNGSKDEEMIHDDGGDMQIGETQNGKPGLLYMEIIGNIHENPELIDNKKKV